MNVMFKEFPGDCDLTADVDFKYIQSQVTIVFKVLF